MSARIRRSTTQVLALYTQIDSGTLNLSPAFQRNDVWTPADKKDLIMSIVRGQHIPELLVYENPEGCLDVVDGQQRLRSIHGFMKNEFPLPKIQEGTPLSEFSKQYYSDLPQPMKIKIQHYELNLAILDDSHTWDEIGEAYRHVNRGKKLVASELRRALMGTLSQDVVEALARHPIFDSMACSATRKSRRLQRQNMSTKCLVSSFYGGITAIQASDLMKFVTDHKNLTEEHYSYKRTVRIFDYLYAANESLGDNKVILNDGALLDSFLVAQHFLNKYGPRQVAPEIFGKAYQEFDGLRAFNKTLKANDSRLNAEIVSYRDLLRGDKPDRLGPRRDIVERHLLASFEKMGVELKELDSKRHFSREDKEAQLYLCKYQCEKCGKDVGILTAEADHIREHSLGGETSLDNIQMLCKDCHAEKTKAFNQNIFAE